MRPFVFAAFALGCYFLGLWRGMRHPVRDWYRMKRRAYKAGWEDALKAATRLVVDIRNQAKGKGLP